MQQNHPGKGNATFPSFSVSLFADISTHFADRDGMGKASSYVPRRCPAAPDNGTRIGMDRCG
jgi:hypothetical protein